MPVNLKQIAEYCGLSRQTVGFILTGKKAHLFKPETREKVINAARELGYRPHSGAQAMAGKRFNAIGLLCGLWEGASYIHHKLLEGICYALKEHEMHLTLAFLPDEQILSEKNRPKFLSYKMVDGLILNYTHSVPEGMDSLLQKSSLPCVWINTKKEFNSVYPDDFEASSTNTNNLIDAGFSSILYYDPGDACHLASNDLHYSVFDRRNGYVQAMTCRKRKPIVFSEDTVSTAVTLAIKNKKKKKRTAYITYTPVQALKLYGILERNRISVPDEAIILTFNLNLFGDSELDSKIKVINVPQGDMGRIAVQMVLTMVMEKTTRIESKAVLYSKNPVF